MALLPSRLITVENQSSIVTNKELFDAVWGCNYQCLYQFGRSPWFSIASGHLMQLPAGQKPPVGAAHLIVMDKTTEAGALGFHEDEVGNTIPYAEVFAQTAKENDTRLSEVMSHEVLELLVDPFVADESSIKTVKNGDKEYIVEVCDAVQGNGYDVGIPYGVATGVIVADFVYPSWFGMPENRLPNNTISTLYSYRNSVSKPFTLAAEGYISYKENGGEWKQSFGEKITKSPAWASRLPRIHPV